MLIIVLLLNVAKQTSTAQNLVLRETPIQSRSAALGLFMNMTYKNVGMIDV